MNIIKVSKDLDKSKVVEYMTTGRKTKIKFLNKGISDILKVISIPKQKDIIYQKYKYYKSEIKIFGEN